MNTKIMKRIFTRCIIIIFCLCSFKMLQAQRPQKTLILQDQDLGNKNYVARDEIVFSPGYDFNSSNGGQMDAKTDDKMVCDMDYQTPISSNEPRYLNFNLPVGTTVGSFSVSPSGAATYQIPISAPPGTAGIQPSLSIAYNSQGGNGLLGPGFDLTGLSAITRIPENLFTDGLTTGLSLSTSDRFALDGNRLMVTSGLYGSEGSVYKTETETFSTITAYDTYEGGVSYFKVVTKDGKTLEYGNSDDSKMKLSGKSNVLLWRINKITDVNGNYMAFLYRNENGESVIDHIDYTGNDNTGLHTYNQLQFYYERRSDQSTSYVAGGSMDQSLLLYQIKIVCAGNVEHTYGFEYTNDGFTESHLTKVSETSRDGQMLNPTVINWGNDATNIKLLSTSIHIYNGDFNGDGKTDYVSLTYNGVDSLTLYVSNGTSNTRLSTVSLEDDDFTKMFYPLDYNGDGMTDLLYTTYNTSNHKYNYYVLLSNGTGFNSSSFVCTYDENRDATDADYLSRMNKPLIGDFNGDGKDEFIIQQVHSGVHTGILNGINTLNFDLGTRVYWGNNSYAADFNGDGKAEILTQVSFGSYLYFLAANGKMANSGQLSYPTSDVQLYFGDFNGDGKTDLLGFNKTSQKWNIRIFNGVDYSISWPCPLTAPPVTTRDNNSTNTEYHVFDINNDGKSDIIQLSEKLTRQSCMFLQGCYEPNFRQKDDYTAGFYYSDGRSLGSYQFLGSKHKECTTDRVIYCKDETESYVGNPILCDKSIVFSTPIITDINGDGISEWNGYTFNDNLKDHFVSNILNGFNINTKITYKPLSGASSTLYTKDSSVKGSIKNYQGALMVVDTVITPNGNGHKITTTYNYSGAKIQTSGKGFLGFTKVGSSNSLGKNNSTYDYNTTYYDPYLVSTEGQTPAGTTLSKTTYAYTDIDLGGRRVFSFPSTITKTDIMGNTTIIKSQYDSFGNLLSENTSVNSGESSVTKSFSGYNTFGSPDTVIVKSSRSGEDDITRTLSYTYNDNGSIHTSVSDGVTTTYGYNSIGNLTSTVLSANGVESRSSSSDYDNFGRFAIRTFDSYNHKTSEVTSFDVWGHELSQIDADGLLTTHDYDTWGRLKTTHTTDGKTSTCSYTWIVGGEYSSTDNIPPSNSCYSVNSYTDGVFSGSEYYNVTGQIVRKVTVGFAGATYDTDIGFNESGKISQKLHAYPSSASGATKVTLYSYYPNGRLQTETLPNNVVITYTYTGNSVTSTYSTGEIYTKNYDGAGLLLSSVDPGGTISYAYNSEGKPREINAQGKITTITYDALGRQVKLADLSAGITRYDYDAFGDLTWQKDTLGKITTSTFDKLGRILTQTVDGLTTTNKYNTTSNYGTLASASNTDNTSVVNVYDGLNRLIEQTKSKGTISFKFKYDYDSKGKVSKLTYPTGFVLTYGYNSNDDLTSIYNATDPNNPSLIWKIDNVNAMSQLQNATYGNGKQLTYGYDGEDRLSRIYVPNMMDFNYQYNTKQQLNYRDEKYYIGSTWQGFRENFTYDGVNRLKTATVNGTEILHMNYPSTGSDRIESKSDIGAYNYVSGNHKLDNITPVSGYLPPEHDLTYTSSGMVKTVTEGNKLLTLDYGIDGGRFKSEYKENGTRKYTRYYCDTYEKEVLEDGSERNLNYIIAGGNIVAIYEQKTSGNAMHYIYTDYLGSIRCITDASGNVEQRLGYDAYGYRRDPITGVKLSSITGNLFARGFTGHEHIDELGLINMNARLYDPAVGMFISTDNGVTDPEFTQSYNRFAYCYNNPLMYTDPTGNDGLPTFTFTMPNIEIPQINIPKFEMPQINIPSLNYGSSFNSFSSYYSWFNYNSMYNYSYGYSASYGANFGGYGSFGTAYGSYSGGYSVSSGSYSYAYEQGFSVVNGVGNWYSSSSYFNANAGIGEQSISFSYSQSIGYNNNFEYSTPNVSAISASANQLVQAVEGGAWRNFYSIPVIGPLLEMGDQMQIKGGMAMAGVSLLAAATDVFTMGEGTVERTTTKAIFNYKAIFFAAHPELEGQVIVHHSIEQQVLKRYPNLFSAEEIHSLSNLRGIPNSLNSEVHLSQIRRSWNQFYRTTVNPTRELFINKAAEIDQIFGNQFLPPIE
jgi:RHS repeat-associated protein